MKRSPKAIGTAGETPAARWLQDNGWPTARRQPLTGNRDQGDSLHQLADLLHHIADQWEITE